MWSDTWTGEHTPLLIVKRKIRTGEEENIEICIFSIFCIRAKKQGLQYTKRIQPPFLIPECNISLENVLRYIRLHPDESLLYEEADFILGTHDNRTIRRHISVAWQIIKTAGLHISELLSALPSYARVPELKGPGRTRFLFPQWGHTTISG